MKLLSILFWTFSLGLIAEESEFYNVTEKNFQGKDYKFSEHKGKVTLIVNIASQCGYTPQLKGLQNLYQKYKSKNLILIGVPSNEFGGQTPEGDKEMKAFCELNYGVKFPIMKKSLLKVQEKALCLKYLVGQSKSEIRWNFEKFLVDKNGKLVKHFRSSIHLRVTRI